MIYYKITIIFTGDSKIIKPGMTFNLYIVTARKNNVIMIPFQMLKEKDNRKFVQVLESGTVKNIFAKVRLRGDIEMEIVEGVEEGWEVVTFVEE